MYLFYSTFIILTESSFLLAWQSPRPGNLRIQISPLSRLCLRWILYLNFSKHKRMKL